MARGRKETGFPGAIGCWTISISTLKSEDEPQPNVRPRDLPLHCRFIDKLEDTLFLARGGAGKSQLAQAIGQATILQGIASYREALVSLDELADAVADGTRKQYTVKLTAIPLVVLDDFGMRKLPLHSHRQSSGNRNEPL